MSPGLPGTSPEWVEAKKLQETLWKSYGKPPFWIGKIMNKWSMFHCYVSLLVNLRLCSSMSFPWILGFPFVKNCPTITSPFTVAFTTAGEVIADPIPLLLVNLRTVDHTVASSPYCSDQNLSRFWCNSIVLIIISIHINHIHCWSISPSPLRYQHVLTSFWWKILPCNIHSPQDVVEQKM